MIRLFFSKQFLIFLLTGGIAASINFTTRIVYNNKLDFSTSIILAYITGMVAAFIMARLFVFKETSQSLSRSASMFVLVNCVAITQTWFISIMLAEHLFPALNITFFAHEIAHIIGMAIPAFTSYVGYKYLSFR